MKLNLQGLGLMWYSEATYEWARQNMEDGDTFRTYADWLKLAEQAEQTLRRDGTPFIRVNLDPAEFVAWCTTNGCKVNADGRKRFAAWAAMKADQN